MPLLWTFWNDFTPCVVRLAFAHPHLLPCNACIDPLSMSSISSMPGFMPLYWTLIFFTACLLGILVILLYRLFLACLPFIASPQPPLVYESGFFFYEKGIRNARFTILGGKCRFSECFMKTFWDFVEWCVIVQIANFQFVTKLLHFVNRKHFMNKRSFYEKEFMEIGAGLWLVYDWALLLVDLL